MKLSFTPWKKNNSTSKYTWTWYVRHQNISKCKLLDSSYCRWLQIFSKLGGVWSFKHLCTNKKSSYEINFIIFYLFGEEYMSWLCHDVCMCACVFMCVLSRHQEFPFPSIIWVPGIKLRSSDLTAAGWHTQLWPSHQHINSIVNSH